MKSLKNYWTADFETTTDVNDCRVWAYSLCNIEDYHKFCWGTSIDDFFDWIMEYDGNLKIFYHNLKFDAQFLLSYLFIHSFKWVDTSKEKPRTNTFTTLIGDMGEFYSLTVYFKIKGHKTHKVEFFDSLKIFPNFSVERVAEGFDLPIRKLKIDYRKYRPVGYELTPEEIDYIRNDVEIMARALNHMFIQGLTKMTIAGDAMKDFKTRIVGFRKKFPILSKEEDAGIRKAYKGGFTYVNEKWQGKPVGRGLVLDVNSLYPSTLVSSECPMPYGKAVFYEGEYKDDNVYPLYIQCFQCSFDIKPDKIPMIQLKNNMNYSANEYVKTSYGEMIELTLTKPDFELFKEQYKINKIKYLYGWKFKSSVGYFDNYINYWIEQKIKASKEGNAPQRQISKLLVNSLYGRFSLSGTSRQKAPYLGDDDIVHYKYLEAEERETCYIPVGCYVTSYGRNKTVRSSQAIRDFTEKKYGIDKYFYSDTDSIHADLSKEDLEELKDVIHIDPYKLGYWSIDVEEFTRALYIRQKCYIEEIEGKVHVTVAGLPKYLAPIVNFDNFRHGFTTENLTIEDMEEMARRNGASEQEIEELHHKLSYTYTQGGVVLTDTDFTIK